MTTFFFFFFFEKADKFPNNLVFLCRDRFRTMVNVMGDALATGIMAHICRKDFVKEGEQVRGPINGTGVNICLPRVHVKHC